MYESKTGVDIGAKRPISGAKTKRSGRLTRIDVAGLIRLQRRRVHRKMMSRLLIEVRNERGLSRKAVAAVLQISEHRVRNLERARVSMSAAEWYFFCKATNISCDSAQYGEVLWRDRPPKMRPRHEIITDLRAAGYSDEMIAQMFPVPTGE